MNNIKITQEAREAAAVFAESDGEFFAEPHDRHAFVTDCRAGKCDAELLVVSMQALINQTVERCADIAITTAPSPEVAMTADSLFGYSFARDEIATAIRTLKGN